MDTQEKAIDGDVAAQLSELDRLQSMAGEDFKPEPGAEVQERPGASIDTALMCTQVVTVLFAILAKRRGDHWPVDEKEAALLGGAVAAVLDKYAPGYQGGPEGALIITALMIVGPRLATDAQNRALEGDGAGGDKKSE